MDISELEDVKVDDGQFENEEDDSVQDDIREAISLLRKSRTMLCYLADPDLCKSLSKRERDAMDRLNTILYEFLVEVGPAYEEEE